ncbi:hypothetical protein HYS47_04435 [Candidatus Woesearchaeota archaeon]|nr:hypothetical protein [Candidatus Woesearchaeota archaeon]
MAANEASEQEDISRIFVDFFPGIVTDDSFWDLTPNQAMKEAILQVKGLIIKAGSSVRELTPDYKGEELMRSTFYTDASVLTIRREYAAAVPDGDGIVQLPVVNVQLTPLGYPVFLQLTDHLYYRQRGKRPEQLSASSLQEGNPNSKSGIELLAAVLPKMTMVRAIRDDCLQYGMPPQILKYLCNC